MQTIIDGNLINYELIGEKNENTVLILHGWQNSLKNWENVGKRLAKKNKVILVDLPGFGGSSLPKTQPFGTYDYADTVNKLILKLGLKKITLLGHSFGGKIAVIVASRNPAIKKLILVDISGIKTTSLSTSLKISVAKFLKFFLPENFSTIISSDDYKNAGNLLPTFKKIVAEYIEKDAKKLTIPTLIVWGENDQEVPLASAVTLKKLIPNSSLRIVWKAGHHPHLEKPEKFLEILYDFI